MMAWLWIWDEFDDFQDGISQLRGGSEGSESQNGGFSDQLVSMELIVSSILLGFFGQLLGISDPMQLIIPGRLGFAQYICRTLPPPPWGTILSCVYEVVAFVLANVIASGAKGVGWVFYLAGSVIGNMIVNGFLGGY